MTPGLDRTMHDLWVRLGEWSTRTFGDSTARDHIGPLKHLALEAVEAQAPDAGEDEFADCLILVFDAARRRGISYERLIEIAHAKMGVNERRQWLPQTNGEPARRVRDVVDVRRNCTACLRTTCLGFDCPERTL